MNYVGSIAGFEASNWLGSKTTPSNLPRNEATPLANAALNHHPLKKITIIGGGIIGVIHALLSHLESQKFFFFAEPRQLSSKLKITVLEKNSTISETTSSNIVPSLTCDELLSVVPLGQELIKALNTPFNSPGGVKINDIEGVQESAVALKFKEEVLVYSRDSAGHKARVASLLELGKLGMELWQQVYDKGDAKLQAILEEANFNPCREPRIKGNNILHDGYRIDLIYQVAEAVLKAQTMRDSYVELGYPSCRLLSPAEVVAIDPSLADFCKDHSNDGHWHHDSVALWRPGGCVDAKVLLPKLYTYLSEAMGTYTNAVGKIKNCFQLRLGREVSGIKCTIVQGKMVIKGLEFGNRLKSDKSAHQSSEYIFCPGSAIGTLGRFGFQEPAYAGFAGASLQLNIPLQGSLCADEELNHCMEVHRPGVVLAWQARLLKGKSEAFIGVAGTKAFYGDYQPSVTDEFAKDRNLLQLNMINDVLPKYISQVLGRDTRSAFLSEGDLFELERQGHAKRWVGTRAVTYDGYPLYGFLYSGQQRIDNALATTYLGSGGASFAIASVIATLAAKDEGQSLLEAKDRELIVQVLKYADSRRMAGQTRVAVHTPLYIVPVCE